MLGFKGKQNPTKNIDDLGIFRGTPSLGNLQIPQPHIMMELGGGSIRFLQGADDGGWRWLGCDCFPPRPTMKYLKMGV